jgi:hypothetical protein
MFPENKKATNVFPFHGKLPSWLCSNSYVNVESDPAISPAFDLPHRRLFGGSFLLRFGYFYQWKNDVVKRK